MQRAFVRLKTLAMQPPFTVPDESDPNQVQSHNVLPHVLYKYCGPERMDILRNRLVRFTQSEDLNDIYEMKPTVVFDHEAYKIARERVAENYPEVPGLGPGTAEDYKEEVLLMLRRALVLSLSSAWNILPMWARYANCHSGLVIGFDTRNCLERGRC
jgi:hypothetical protein